MSENPQILWNKHNKTLFKTQFRNNKFMLGNHSTKPSFSCEHTKLLRSLNRLILETSEGNYTCRRRLITIEYVHQKGTEKHKTISSIPKRQ